MDPREYAWQMGDLADTGIPPRVDLREGPRAVMGGLATIGDYLGVPRGEVRNAAGDVVFPTNALERGLQGSSDAQTAIAAGVMGPGGKAPPPGAILGMHPTTTPARIYNQTVKGGGYSVNIPSGEIPSEGLMVGRYKNTDPRNVVVPKEEFSRADVRRMAETNAAEFAKPDRYFGTWISPEDQVMLDVVQRFDPNVRDAIRKATKFGERTGQLGIYNVGTQETLPVGNWREFVKSPEFFDRMYKMEDVGGNYLSQHPNREWWDTHGTPFERVYGEQNLPQVAGFSASTAPNTAPRENMRVMSEYMRRYLSGEPVVQPDWRAGEGNVWLSEGKKMPMEASRAANLNKTAAGDLEAIRRAKVREEVKAMMGDPSAVVLDRHWARITEDPSRGIFAGPKEGVINTNIPKRGLGDYDYVKGNVTAAAQTRNRDPRDFSADVWTGIRETIKRTGELFGTKYRRSAITGESKSYADHFQDLLEEKAARLGISTKELDKRLRSGDADLLSTMMVGSPVLWGAYQTWLGGEAPGSLARQDQYQ